MSANEKGIFELREPKDLFDKLKWEFDQFNKSPDDQYLAFNFFVTAEHIPDWLNIKPIRKKHAILRICSHLANGGKHFQVDRHKSIKETQKDRFVEGGYVESGYFEETLIIKLSNSEAKKFGKKSIPAIELANKVFAFWENYFK